MKKIETYIVDSFTDQAFKGNPAGVCILNGKLSDSKMLLVAKELGLSETAFIGKLNDNNEYPIRFFSPAMEIPLCGHATFASSKVVFEKKKFGRIIKTHVEFSHLFCQRPLRLHEVKKKSNDGSGINSHYSGSH